MATTREEQNVRYWLTDTGWAAARDAENAIARGDLEPPTPPAEKDQP